MVINGQIINDDLALIQSDIVNVLRSDPALGWTAIYKFKDFVPADVEKQNLASWQDVSNQWGGPVLGKQGTCIEVRMPAVRPTYPNEPGPQLVLEQTLRVMEDAAMNSTGITCEGLGLEILAWLDGMVFEGLDGAVYTLLPMAGGLAMRPVYHEYNDRFAYDVVFTSALPRNARIRVMDVTPADDGAGNVTLTCPTAGAGIYYTTDGSCPVIPPPGFQPTGATKLFASAFAIPSGTTVTALAWAAGLLPSGLFRGTLTY